MVICSESEKEWEGSSCSLFQGTITASEMNFYRKPQKKNLMIAVNPSEIQTAHLINRILESYHFTEMLSKISVIYLIGE
jgi:hypothetical protein